MSAVLEIDLDAIADNWRDLATRHGGPTAGVIKADGYGLGALKVAPKLWAAGCRHFFVAHLSEAVAVRGVIPDSMLAVLNGILPGEESAFAAYGIVPVVGSLAELALWRAYAALSKCVLPVIVHVDTGMARLGLSPAELTRLRGDEAAFDGLDVLYVMTHLVSADRAGDPMNGFQVVRFNDACRQFPRVPRSFANSSGLFLGPVFGSDLARPGAASYGVNPVPGQANPMRPVVRLSAPILQVREIEAGETVGYEGAWTAARRSRIATLGVGYADGYLRALSNKAIAYFNGEPVPLVGRVSMDLTTFDVTDVPAGVGDWLELINGLHGVDELALAAGTNGYEILTSLGRRYQRRYSGVL